MSALWLQNGADILLNGCDLSIHLFPSGDLSSGSSVVDVESQLKPWKGVFGYQSCSPFAYLQRSFFQPPNGRWLGTGILGCSSALWDVTPLCQCCRWEVIGPPDEFFSMCMLGKAVQSERRRRKEYQPVMPPFRIPGGTSPVHWPHEKHRSVSQALPSICHSLVLTQYMGGNTSKGFSTRQSSELKASHEPHCP